VNDNRFSLVVISFVWVGYLFGQNLVDFRWLGVVTTDFTDYTDSIGLVFLAVSILKASFIIENCLRPPGRLALPTYD